MFYFSDLISQDSVIIDRESNNVNPPRFSEACMSMRHSISTIIQLWFQHRPTLQNHIKYTLIQVSNKPDRA
jgi:hypothetical protein